MSGLYSGSLKTQYFEPRIDISNNLCEFRLDPETAYYSNLMLGGLKATADAQVAYHLTPGVYSIIKSIRLMDGRVELDSLKNANLYLSWLNVNNTNRHNINVLGKLDKSQNGFQLNDTGDFRTTGGELYQNIYAKTTANAVARDEGLLDLRVALPMLRNISYLDTSVFKNLKIVIEWESDSKKIVIQDNRTVATQRPQLIVDEIRDPQIVNNLKNNLKSVVWNSIEHDQISIPDGETESDALGTNPIASVEKSHQNVVNGFDNKFVERMVMIKSFTDQTKEFTGNNAYGFSVYSSHCQLLQKEQFRINGRNLLPGEGITSESQRAMLLHQTWGDCNILPYGNVQNIGLDVQTAASQNKVGVPVLSATKINRGVGQQCYTGITINERINQFVLNYKRTLINMTDTIKKFNYGLTIHIFSECRKGIQIDKNEYAVQYL